MPGTPRKGVVKGEKTVAAGKGAQVARSRLLTPSAPAGAGVAPRAGIRPAAGPQTGLSGQVPAAPSPVRGAVVVDPLPLYRAGAVAALASGGIPVLGEAAQLTEGIEMARRTRASVLLAGGASVAEATEAVNSLAECAVLVLMGQPSREELVEMLGTGVAGFALRSLTPAELVSTVESVAGGTPGAPKAAPPVFMPVLVAAPKRPAGPPAPAGEPILTPKEQEILVYLARGASNKRMAEALYVTPATVKTHLAHVYAKLGARGRHEAVTRALALGLVR